MYAFHRGLAILNLFLASYGIARWDNSMRQISSRELRPVIMIGRLNLENHWEERGLMLMHADARERVPISVAAIEARVGDTVEAILRPKPLSTPSNGKPAPSGESTRATQQTR